MYQVSMLFLLLFAPQHFAYGIVSVNSVAQGEDSAVSRFLAPWQPNKTSSHKRYTSWFCSPT
jgi:hypothetical protein